MSPVVKPVKRFCGKCGNRLMGYRTSDGLIKMHCVFCGTMSVAKKVSRRHVIVDEHISPNHNTK